MFTLKTAYKIFIARVACSVILGGRKLIGLSKDVTATRGGIRWSLDLAEGIDFSIYLLGGFEPKTIRLYKKLVKPGYTVLDIGANIGAHTLPLAQLVGPEGKVVAFEPTRFASEKLHRNIDLNPDLKGQIITSQTMLVADEQEILEPEIYSSWPLFETEKKVHTEHRGLLMDTRGAVAMTLDRALLEMQVSRVDFIKLDVDGHEYSVIAGGKKFLTTQTPPILMELAPYLFSPESQQFEQMIGLFARMGYELSDADSGKALPLDPIELRKTIPVGGTRNVLLVPTNKKESRY